MAWATKLVGRGTELGELRRELQRARAAEFRIVLLLSDAGIGKTRLAREFLARSRAGVVGLAARAHPLGEMTSFGVWSEALESHLRGLPPNEITELCGGFLDDLAALLHSVAAVHGSTEREPSRSCSRTSHVARPSLSSWMTRIWPTFRRGRLLAISPAR